MLESLCAGPEERPLPTAVTDFQTTRAHAGNTQPQSQYAPVKESRINNAVKPSKNTQEGNHL